MNRRCLDCGLLIEAGSRCRACHRARERVRERKYQGQKNARRSGSARSDTPAKAKARDKACRRCGSTTDLEAHHVIPVKDGGTHDLSNLVTLCKTCHRLTHHTPL